jgi:hypothetical protein
MKVYLAHSTSFDFQTELYKTIEDSDLYNKLSFIFPHKLGEEVGHSKQTISECDLLIAEVSYPSTGMGIELGWAESFKVPVLAVCQNEKRPSSSIRCVTDVILFYDKNNLADVIKTWLEKSKK